MRLSDTKIVKFIDIWHQLFKAVHFVYYKNHRLMGTAKHIRHLRIRILKSLTYICDKHDHICRINRYLRLLSHL